MNEDDLVQSIDVGLGIPLPDELPPPGAEEEPPPRPEPLPPLEISDETGRLKPVPLRWPAEDVPAKPPAPAELPKPAVPLDTPTMPAYDRPLAQEFDEPGGLPETEIVPGPALVANAPPAPDPLPVSPPPLPGRDDQGSRADKGPVTIARRTYSLDDFGQDDGLVAEFDEPEGSSIPESSDAAPGEPSPLSEEEPQDPGEVKFSPEEVRQNAASIRRRQRFHEGLRRRRMAKGLPAEMSDDSPEAPEEAEDDEEPPRRASRRERWEAAQERRRAATGVPNEDAARRAVASVGDAWGGPGIENFAKGNRESVAGGGGGGGEGAMAQVLEELRDLNQTAEEMSDLLAQLLEAAPGWGAVGP